MIEEYLAREAKLRKAKLKDVAKRDAGHDFELPFIQTLLNANLCYMKTVEPGTDQPARIKYEGRGVRAEVIVTGVAANRSQPVPGSSYYGIPEISIELDVLVMDGGSYDCSVLSTIKLGDTSFDPSTTYSEFITLCDRPVAGDIGAFIVNQAVAGALNSAAHLTLRQYERSLEQSPMAIRLIHHVLFPKFDTALRNDVGSEINAALAALNSPLPFNITTGAIMAPFLVFSVRAYDLNARTLDINFDGVGFSTVLQSIFSGHVAPSFATALSLLAQGQAHVSPTGLTLTLNYKVNVGTGLIPVGRPFANFRNRRFMDGISDAINRVLIPKLEAYLNKLLPARLDEMLYILRWYGGN